MSDPQGCVPTFLVNLRHDTGPHPYIASVSIVHPDVVGFRGIVRRFTTKHEIVNALEHAGIEQNRYAEALTEIDGGSYCCLAVTQNEAQKLQILQTDSPE